jgi:uncharacterized membrane protein
MGLIWVLVVILAILGIAALVKYVFFKGPAHGRQQTDDGDRS